jgi:PAS domain S-box-containing protein
MVKRMRNHGVSGVKLNGEDAIDEIPVAYVELDLEGRITRANRAACALQKMSEAELLGCTPWQFMPSDEIEQNLDAFAEVIQKGQPPATVRRTFYTTAGEFKMHEVHRSLMHDEEQRVIGMRLVLFDVTEAQIAHEEAQRARCWMESVLAALNEAVIVTDALGFVRSMNPTAEKLSGWSASELIGRSIEKGLPILRFTAESNQPRQFFRMGLDGPCKGRAIVLNHAREQIEVEINAAPILDPEQGYTTGVVSHWRLIEK